MVRSLFSFAFVLIASLVLAQNPDIQIKDTEAMKATANDRMAQVDQLVTLSAEQKDQVSQVYLEVERQMAAMAKRYESAPKEDYEADVKHMYRTMDEYVDHKLKSILSEGQMSKWRSER